MLHSTELAQLVLALLPEGVKATVILLIPDDTGELSHVDVGGNIVPEDLASVFVSMLPKLGYKTAIVTDGPKGDPARN